LTEEKVFNGKEKIKNDGPKQNSGELTELTENAKKEHLDGSGKNGSGRTGGIVTVCIE
jgi:hypothetical protein